MKEVDSILQKEMTRKEFLTTLGFGMAAVLGFSNILRFLFNKGHSSSRSATSASAGYGSNVYGGLRR